MTDSDPSSALLDSVNKAKRHTVATACQYCRRKRIKCDGRRPCSECSRRKLDCQYSTRENETPQQAQKRRFDEVTRTNEDLRQLFDMLASRDEQRAIEVFRRIRSGQPLDTIIEAIRHGTIHPALELSLEQRLRRAFLTMLVSSTASMHEIASVTSSVLDSDAQVALPSLEIHNYLRDTIITPEHIAGVLSEANPSAALSDGVSTNGQRSAFAPVADGFDAGPIFFVPADPWTRLTSNDDAVSYMISIFLTAINTSWRVVEEDVFLRDMRTKRLDSRYCSSLLVNAILACASLFCERDGAFSTAGQYISRGAHFHQEAVRLWNIEQGKASLTNMQALLVLSMETSLRAQDRLGASFVSAALEMRVALHIPNITDDSSEADRTYWRVISCAWWAVAHLQATYAITLLRDKNFLPLRFEGAPDLREVIPDTVVPWTGYPFFRSPKALKPNLLFQHRSSLTRLMYDTVSIVLSDDSRLRPFATFWPEVQMLLRRLKTWYDELPAEIEYSKTMPAPQYELHAQYYCVLMAIYEQTYVSLFGPTSQYSDVAKSSAEMQVLEAHLRSRVLESAYSASNCVRDFRLTYGFKVTQIQLLHAATVGGSVLMIELHRQAPAQRDARRATSSEDTAMAEIHSAFEECFRALLATGMQFMYGRAVSRMMYQTANRLDIQLSGAVLHMIQAVADTAWHPSDIHQLSSSYPNWVIAHVRRHNEEYRMEDLLGKWEETTADDQVMVDGQAVDGIP